MWVKSICMIKSWFKISKSWKTENIKKQRTCLHKSLSKRSFTNGIHSWLKRADARESADIIYVIPSKDAHKFCSNMTMMTMMWRCVAFWWALLVTTWRTPTRLSLWDSSFDRVSFTVAPSPHCMMTTLPSTSTEKVCILLMSSVWIREWSVKRYVRHHSCRRGGKCLPL